MKKSIDIIKKQLQKNNIQFDELFVMTLDDINLFIPGSSKELQKEIHVATSPFTLTKKTPHLRYVVLISTSTENITWKNDKEAILQKANYIDILDIHKFIKNNGKNLDLEAGNFQGALLEGADLREANLSNCSFKGANLKLANFKNANLEGANLEGANLIEANLFGANLKNTDLRRANLTLSELRKTKLDGTSLRGAELWSSSIWGVDFSKAFTEGVDLSRADNRGS
ncbi:pentapeptide repeat-containing protein [Bacillus thuringiensis]|uniref:Pentapeptide repeat-containing protein n=1 Tax=Bacillus thuringiensis serovar toumanoffi TaxID=180862 RepID=A0ABD5HQT1_BACTU|nr:pentapeptide repeat-containing protein [Bacillus thuringiensis]EEM92340.1 hypothetical protein bthur0013_63170 [Bacillus thuringiensis IBL 200]MCR6783909.1 pentapeptide repeat-containing protein [Bacillus thuringiensis]MCR6861817.1 pentapeptide repeat-containing protein [Bacillus thuringiensis]MCR6868679.1 pentapeptide repeat-containing protein [Bacillus thuringiensis]MDW9207242.1 pentapeptide repeat-containing protein [Bacillus thuringiensis serovar toumanoffi]